MRPGRPIGLVRPLVPILGRPRRPGRRGLVPLVWRSRRPRAGRPFAPPAGRPHATSLHFGISLRLTWASTAAAGAATERILERIVGEAFRAASASVSGPGSARRRLPALIRLCRQDRGRAAPAAGGDSALSFPSSPFGAGAADLRGRLAASPPDDLPMRPMRRKARTATPADRPAIAIHAAVASRNDPARPAPAAHRVLSRRPGIRANAAVAGETPARPEREIAAPVWRDREARLGRSRSESGPASARSGAILAWRESRVWRGSAAASAPRPGIAAWPVPSGSRPARNELIWREPAAAGAPRPGIAAWPNPSGSKPARTELVWREPAEAEKRDAAAPEAGVSLPRAWSGDTVVHSRQASAAAAAAAVPTPNVAQLVDEVVRRLERIGRDERLRRGL